MHDVSVDAVPRHCDPSTQYACANGRCIPLRLVNNTVNDCEDNSDEGKCQIHVHDAHTDKSCVASHGVGVSEMYTAPFSVNRPDSIRPADHK